MENKAYKDFIAACKIVFNTEPGQKVLAYLKSSYVDSSAVGESPELTYYKLGQKELIQSLIKHINDERKLETLVNSLEYMN